MGDFMCDAMLDYIANSTGLLEEANPGVLPVCVVNAGGIRWASFSSFACRRPCGTEGMRTMASPACSVAVSSAGSSAGSAPTSPAAPCVAHRSSVPAGNVTQGDITSVSPFGGRVADLDGSTLVEGLNQGLAGWSGDSTATGRFPQASQPHYQGGGERASHTKIATSQRQPDSSSSNLIPTTGAACRPRCACGDWAPHCLRRLAACGSHSTPPCPEARAWSLSSCRQMGAACRWPTGRARFCW